MKVGELSKKKNYANKKIIYNIFTLGTILKTLIFILI